MTTQASNEGILYEPDDPCPLPVAISVGIQGVLLVIAPTVLYVSVAAVAADQPDAYLSWAVFASLIINGIVTALHAGRLGRIGARHVLISGTAGNFIAVSVTALSEGGPALLASLVLVSSLFQFVVAAWLPLLRRIITPVVSGTVYMLIAAMIIPIAIDSLDEAHEHTSLWAYPTVAMVTLAVALMLGLRATGRFRLLSTLIGIASGVVVAALFGLYEVDRIVEAPWVGLPNGEFPGFRFAFGPHFWGLLPVFLIVTLVSTIKIIGGGSVVQQTARRNMTATDFRLVQGAVNANGIGTMLTGITGTMPTITYEAFSVSLTNFTGVAARKVGYIIGIVLVAMAMLPKLTAVLLSIPAPVTGAYILMTMGILFVEGMRTVIQEGLDYRKTLIAGVAFAIGLGFESQTVFGQLLTGVWGEILTNGLTVGAIAAVAMNLFVEITGARIRRLRVELDMASLPRMDAFLRDVASRQGWDRSSQQRLSFIGEETLAILLQDAAGSSSVGNTRHLLISARPEARILELEFLTAFDDDENIEDRLAYLDEQMETPSESEISFRILRHYASSVRHRKYHGIDIVTVEVQGGT